MSARLRHTIVEALLRLYPARWRREYGAELEDVLLARPLSARIVADVLGSGVGQRVRALEPSTVLGLAMMLVTLGGLAWNIAAPLPYRAGWTVIVEDSHLTLPRISVRLMGNELYVLALVACGYWTQKRAAHGRARPGFAAARLTLIAGLPVILAGALMMLGVLGLAVAGPSEAPTTFQQHGFALTVYGTRPERLMPLMVFVSTFFRLPGAWLWGAIGGGLYRYVARTNPRLSES